MKEGKLSTRSLSFIARKVHSHLHYYHYLQGVLKKEKGAKPKIVAETAVVEELAQEQPSGDHFDHGCDEEDDDEVDCSGDFLVEELGSSAPLNVVPLDYGMYFGTDFFFLSFLSCFFLYFFF